MKKPRYISLFLDYIIVTKIVLWVTFLGKSICLNGFDELNPNHVVGYSPVSYLNILFQPGRKYLD